VKKTLLSLLITVSLVATVWAASSGVTLDPSRTLYSARQLGMGGVSIGFSDDANGIFSDPSDLTQVGFPQLLASSRKITLDETQYTLLGWAVPTDYGTFGIGFAGMDMGGSLASMLDPNTGRVMLNPSLEAMSYANSVVAFSYSRAIEQPYKLSLGGNLKFYNQALSGGVSDRGTGMNIDLSAGYQLQPWLKLGAVLQNVLGGSVKWNNSEDKMGGYYKVGGAVNILGPSQEALQVYPQTLRGGIELGFPSGVLATSNSMLYHLGLEYFPAKNVALRGGINQEINGSSLTLGVGLINGGFRFDYAYCQRPGLPGDTPHYFSLSYIGERVLSVFQKLKDIKVGLDIIRPKDRMITDKDSITVSAQATKVKVIERKRIWTVTAISATQEIKEETESEPLDTVYINGVKIDQRGTIEYSSPLTFGRNVISFSGFTTYETLVGKNAPEIFSASTEVKVLRFTPFSDITMDYWAIEPIALSLTLGLVQGYPDGSFKPERGITRAELVTLLVRSLGLSEETLDPFSKLEIFKDVKPEHWASKYIAYSNEAKLVMGYPDKTFKPNAVLTKAEGVTLLARYAGLSEEVNVAAAPFADLDIEFWANQYIIPAKAAGLLKYLEGKDFTPQAEFTRAEACEVLYRVASIQKKVNQFWDTGVISASQ
jgi:hypothetical protein